MPLITSYTWRAALSVRLTAVAVDLGTARGSHLLGPVALPALHLPTLRSGLCPVSSNAFSE